MPLNIIIVGAGLGGLGGAIALNRAGHNVQVFEKSSFLNEVGAAIHVAPNATRILKAWGCDLDWLRPVHCEKLQIWNSKGDLVRTPIVTEEYQDSLGVHDEWVLTHRVDLHSALRATAARDAEAGEVLLKDGTKYTADLIVGADGIHSRSVHAIIGPDRTRISTGQNCFRFLVPFSKMQNNALTASLLTKIGLDGVHVFATHDRRLVLYPCRRGQLLNEAGIYPSEPAEDGSHDASWHNAGSVEELLETFEGFSEELREMCRMAEDVKLWSLASRDPAPTFVKGKLALVGDAAHPMLPHQGQGAAQTFEDTAALAGVLPGITGVDQLPQRLDLYNKLRYAHAVTVMMIRRFVPVAVSPECMFGYTWTSDPMREARRVIEGAR